MEMPISLAQVEEARRNIAPVAFRTPLVPFRIEAPAALASQFPVVRIAVLQFR